MKTKYLLTVAIAVAGLGAWSCSKEESHTQEVSAIELTAPENGAAYNLQAESFVVFQWLIVPGAGKYTFYLSTSADLSGAETKTNPSGRMSIIASDLDAMLDDLGIPYTATTKLYWTVKPDNNPDAHTEVRELTLTRRAVPVVTPAYPKSDDVIDLGAIDQCVFRWTTEPVTSKFTLLLSTAGDMSSPEIIPVRNVGNYTLTAEAFDNLLAEKFGVAAGATRQLYWTVRPGSEESITFKEPFTVKRIAGTAVNVSLTAPANDASLKLAKADSLENITFSWTASPGASSYALVLSASADMSNPISVHGLTEPTYSLTQAALQDLLFTNSSNFGLKKYLENTVYWKVKVDGRLGSNAPATVKITGMPIFKDVRGKETITYDVSILTYNKGNKSEKTVIWLSNNLRAWNDVDGNELEPRLCKDPVKDGFDPQREGTPFMNEPDRGLYYNPFHADLYGKIVPKDWQMPAWDDWVELYMAAMREYPKKTSWGNNTDYNDIVVLIDPKYAKAVIKDDPRCNEWKMNFRPTGRYLYDAFGVLMDDAAYPQHWFFVFDNTPDPFGTYETQQPQKGMNDPKEPKTRYGWTINHACDGDKWYCSPDTYGAPVRLIYIGD
jgi:hypothetical protein